VDLDGVESADSTPIGARAGAADLSPRPTTLTPKRKRKLMPSLVLAGVLVASGFIVFQFLNASTVFFCNADEIGVKADCRGSRHIRLQGTVDNGSVHKGTPLVFTVSYGGTTIPVTYQGDPGGVFCEGVPVVVEGVMTSGTFAGDRILVKHTEQYKAANPNRVRECGI
jgi:cytochrome c-type biogenesis protein CcmE